MHDISSACHYTSLIDIVNKERNHDHKLVKKTAYIHVHSFEEAATFLGCGLQVVDHGRVIYCHTLYKYTRMCYIYFMVSPNSDQIYATGTPLSIIKAINFRLHPGNHSSI